jgi:benzoyl-CoA reductase/2-hydroxyglutaryl-CoA dehydratase subunit BcrC/BadD/HgdB
MTVNVHAGILDRGLKLFSLIDRLQGIPGDDELEGLFQLLPPDSRENLFTLMAPEVREAGFVFLEMLKEWMFAARDAREEGKKVVLVPFNFPPDLIHAFDSIHPLTTEVLTTIASLALPGGGERYWKFMQSLGLPDHICSANSIEVASILSGLDLKPDAIISAAPGACDANSKVHEFLSHYADIPQFIFEKPVDDTPEGRALYGNYFTTLIEQLEQLSGESLSEDRLRTVAHHSNRCTELYWDIFEYRKLRPCPVPNIFNLFLAPIRFCMWGTPGAVRTLEAMLQTCQRRHEAGEYTAERERVRVLWAYTSYYFNVAQLHRWMGEQGYSFLCDVLSLYLPQPIDTSSKESIIDGLVTAAWEYPMNRQMGKSSMSRAWVGDMVFAARELGADCAIHCGHDACKQTWSVVSILDEELRQQAGVPLLVLHGDSWMKTTTPITVIQEQIEEFFHNIILTKGKSRRKVRRRRPAAGANR